MLFQSINRSLPEKVFINVFNAEASQALANGDICIWKTALTEATGAGAHVLQSTATAALCNVAGVAIGAIAAQTYGLIQIYGFHGAVKGTGTINAGGSNFVVTTTTAGTGKAGTLGTDDAASIGPVLVAQSGGVVGVALRLM